MPPKQKEVKKGPAYKASLSSKDLIPPQIKQPPRQSKSLKYPENIPEAAKNENKQESLFEQWPTQQMIKATNFGLTSQQRFQDPSHEQIIKQIQNSNIISWKSIFQIEKLRLASQEQQNASNKNIDDHEVKSVSHSKIKEPKVQGQEDKGEEKQIVVIETFLRDETAQEQQARIKQQAQKAEKAAKDKKKGKKEEPKQEGPIKISDVKMSDILISDYMTEEGIWVGSQLQIIKIRNLVDAYSKQPVWKKIYPQQNGVPQINKSGRYWVKLYFMGTPIKVQIDDRMPINYSSKQMFPTSEKANEKWTLILTKALIKYFSIVSPSSQILGSGLIFHALTGMISETLSLQNFKDWQQLQILMSDSHYTKKDIFVSCYTTKDQKTPSNYIKNSSQAKDLFLLQNSSFNKTKSPRKASAHNIKLSQKYLDAQQQKEGLQTYVDSRIVKGFAYCIGDYFQNGQFNMAFSKERSPKQMKLREEYNQLSKVSLATKTRQQKLEHRRKKKQIKEQLQIQQKKRLQLINQEKSNYHFIKLLADLQINCEFSEKEIRLAKKCRINNLNQPPNYEVPVDKEENKSIKSFSMIKTTKQEIEVNPNIQDFSVLENAQDILQRKDEGIWIKDLDFITSFTDLQIIYNPSSFEQKTIERVYSKQDSVYTLDETKQILVIEKKQYPEQQAVNQKDIQLLFGINFQQKPENRISSPSCILQKFDFDQFSVSSNIIKLDKQIDSKFLNLKNQNNVFKIYTMCKGNYCFWVSSSSKFKLMSISQYLEEYQGYKKQNFTIQHPALQSQSYFALNKFKITQESQQATSLVLKTISSNSNLSKVLSYKLIKTPQQGNSYVSQKNEGVITKDNEKKLLADQYTKIRIQPKQQYTLVLESFPNENILDGSIQIVALIKNQTLKFESLEQIEPSKYVEKYKSNKYGLILRQRIFSNAINSQSFYVKIVEGEEAQGGGGGDKKAAKKGAKQQSGPQIIEKPYQEKRTIIVNYKKGDQVLYETKGTNWTVISNIQIPSTKEDEAEYFIQARFDLREWPEAKHYSQQTQKIYWVIRSFGTESLALVRDTKQEQKEKETRKSWQDKQPGRAERAKKSRSRFLLQQKKQRGEQLTEEQEQIINQPRLTKKQQIQEDKKNEDKNKKGGKKDDKKAGKDAKKQQIQEKPIEIVFPKSIDNCSTQIKKFLKILQDFKVKKQTLPESQEAKIRSQQEIKSIQQSQNMSEQNRIGKMLKNVQRRQTIKLNQRDKKDKLALHIEQLNNQFKQLWSKYVNWRNQDSEKDKLKQQKERSIIDLLKQQKPSISQAQIEKVLKEYQEIDKYNQKLYDVLVMLKKNIKISNLSEKIQGHLTGWQVEELKAINEQIQTEKIEGIREQIIKQVKVMLQQVEKNPAIVQEKQNEAKKAKKGGKK